MLYYPSVRLSIYRVLFFKYVCMYVSDAMREERKEKRREEMKNLFVTNERTNDELYA